MQKSSKDFLPRKLPSELLQSLTISPSSQISHNQTNPPAELNTTIMPPPQMHLAKASRLGAPSIQGNVAIPNAFLGGAVYVDMAISAENVSVATVNFAPCARTLWHTHAGGQLLTVLAGSGWVCDRGGRLPKSKLDMRL
ncbi:hypothetical protein CONLIGDRAFT_704362 [Coniochaeta ligniaria NRRL 30616]|uniref:Cupin type-1 domain-containing protein n=1 Tax=Coniochaeta ligniaria NRRL 30616 TaxID=1408157 RepID=A0A1J7INI4_9PEZI|nr:hypothetical protein CONLIGDRAFT_704362 [Coniochaeta ligniaria NRRL 30616]